MTNPIDLIIDCDPGIDDALALFLAAASPRELNLLGVTCVAGNRPVATTAANACRLLDAAGRSDVAVFAGAERPLSHGEARCNLVHGEDGLGGVDMPQRRQTADESAVGFLLRSLGSAPEGTITIACIGPLTNLALAEQRRPGVLRRARRLVIMGGAVRCAGNIKPNAEFNFYADPHAAQLVLNAGAAIELFGLDVTRKAVMTPEWIGSLAPLGGRCAALSHQMLLAYAALDPLLHDACPIAWLLRPQLFEGAAWRLAVCTQGDHEGQVSGNEAPMAGAGGGRSNATVHFQVDRDGLLALVREALARLP